MNDAEFKRAFMHAKKHAERYASVRGLHFPVNGQMSEDIAQAAVMSLIKTKSDLTFAGRKAIFILKDEIRSATGRIRHSIDSSGNKKTILNKKKKTYSIENVRNLEFRDHISNEWDVDELWEILSMPSRVRAMYEMRARGVKFASIGHENSLSESRVSQIFQQWDKSIFSILTKRMEC